jgi:hypothetical protein
MLLDLVIHVAIVLDVILVCNGVGCVLWERVSQSTSVSAPEASAASFFPQICLMCSHSFGVQHQASVLSLLILEKGSVVLYVNFSPILSVSSLLRADHSVTSE